MMGEPDTDEGTGVGYEVTPNIAYRGGGVPMAYFGILWYIPQLFQRFSIYQSIPKDKSYVGVRRVKCHVITISLSLSLKCLIMKLPHHASAPVGGGSHGILWYTLVYFGIFNIFFWDFPYTKVYQSIPKYAMGTPPHRGARVVG
eukprot:sb/3473986/